MAANIFTGATNSLFSVATNWSLGTVPTSTDTHTTTFDASSPNCTVNVASNCQSLDFTGYANVLTMSSQLNVTTGTVTFQANQSSRIAGTQSLTLTGNCSIIANGATWNTGISTATAASTKTLTGTLTISGLFIANMVGGGVFNGGTLILNGGLSTQQIQTGTTAITLGGGTWSGGQTISNPITIAGNITLGTTVTALNTTITYSSGTVTVTGSTATFRTCTLNTSGMTWNTVTFGPSNTCTLTSDLNCDTFLFPAGNATVVNGAFNINCNNLTGGSAGTMAGTATIRMIGTGTWSMSTGVLANNLIFDSTGTITVSGAVTYQTGTITYTTGTVITTGSTLGILLDTVLATNGILWNDISITVTAITLTLLNNLTCLGSFYYYGSINSLTLNGNILTIGGNFRATLLTTGVITGTTDIVLNGTGIMSTDSVTGTGGVRNNITINTSGTITIGTTFAYATNTITYTTGTVITTGSTLLIIASATLATNGIIWNNITLGTTLTLTLTTALNINGTFIPCTGGVTVTINTSTVNISGNLSVQGTGGIVTGTSLFNINGTGTWSHTSTTTLRNSMNINTVGIFTISGTVYYNTGTLTYIAGNVNTSGSNLTISATTTLDLGLMPTALNNLITSGASQTITLLSDLYVSGTVTLSSSGTPIWTGNTLYIGGNLIHQTNSVHSGTTTFVMNGTGTYSAASINCVIRNNFTINTTGKITFGAIIAYNTGTFTYLSGKVVVPKNSIMYVLGSTTLINCHKINFDTVQFNQNNIITMNEFFSGSPNKPVKVQSANLLNYIITFQNGYEKIAKFVKVSNMTLTNTAASRGSLLILNNKGKYFRGSNNIGNIRYTNTTPNGIAKGDPTVPNQMTAPIGGYLSDPVFN